MKSSLRRQQQDLLLTTVHYGKETAQWRLDERLGGLTRIDQCYTSMRVTAALVFTIYGELREQLFARRSHSGVNDTGVSAAIVMSFHSHVVRRRAPCIARKLPNLDTVASLFVEAHREKVIPASLLLPR